MCCLAFTLILVSPYVYAQGIPPFSVVVSPESATIAPGDQVSASVRVSWVQQAIAAQASLKASAAAPEVNVTFSPSSGSMPLTSIMRVSVGRNVPQGSYRFSIDATVGDRTQSAFYTVNVAPPQQQPPQQAQTPPLELIYQAFAPATFRIKYLYSNDAKVQVKPLALSNYVYQVGPTNATVSMPQSDNYVITIEVLYPQVVTQTISWSLVGGDPPMLPSGADNFAVSASSLRLLIRVSTTIQPRPPTALELAQATLGLMQNTLDNFDQKYNALVKQNAQNFSTLYIFSTITFAAVVGVIYWVTKTLGSKPFVIHKPITSRIQPRAAPPGEDR